MSWNYTTLLMYYMCSFKQACRDYVELFVGSFLCLVQNVRSPLLCVNTSVTKKILCYSEKNQSRFEQVHLYCALKNESNFSGPH